MSYEIISRANAMALGRTHYFTGKPCRNGHLSPKATRTHSCLQCGRETLAAWNTANKDKLRTYRKRWKAKVGRAALYERVKVARANDPLYKEKTRRANLKQTARKRALRPPPPAPSLNPRNAARRAWAARNSDRVKIWSKNRSALRRGADGSFTKADVVRIWEAQHKRCAYCQVDLSMGAYHVDHIQPIAKGGSNWPKNIQITCQSCNHSKIDKDPMDYARSLGFLL